MKLAILTQPLIDNYGGFLQAFALQSVLEGLGHEVTVVNRTYDAVDEDRVFRIKRAVLDVFRDHPMRDFVRRRIHESTPIYDNESLRRFCDNEAFDGYVVGSDQVWRPLYSPCLTNYFLDFTEGKRVRRMAYAASFGVDHWEYTEEMTARCKALLAHFDAVGVREDSAVKLCADFLAADATQVLDPTMLLTTDDYDRMVDEDATHKAQGTLFTYLLDHDQRLQAWVDRIKERCGLIAYEMFLGSRFKGQEGPSQWIRNLRDATMVLTNSFHGTLFSILYHSDFWVIANDERGNARLSSLLAQFGLEERFIDASRTDLLDFNRPIDWSAVDDRLEEWRTISRRFLEGAVGKEGKRMCVRGTSVD